MDSFIDTLIFYKFLKRARRLSAISFFSWNMYNRNFSWKRSRDFNKFLNVVYVFFIKICWIEYFFGILNSNSRGTARTGKGAFEIISLVVSRSSISFTGFGLHAPINNNFTSRSREKFMISWTTSLPWITDTDRSRSSYFSPRCNEQKFSSSLLLSFILNFDPGPIPHQNMQNDYLCMVQFPDTITVL